MRIPGILLALAVGLRPAAAQSGGTADDVTRFVASARAATERYQDQSAAIADGYRRIGPDFPSMGEHWLSISLAVHAEVDPLHPPILEYVTVGGKPILAGVAYTQLVHEGVPEAPIPAPTTAWHFHRGSVDEESFILSHADASVPATASPGPRIGVLHAWLWLENPAGLFATDNWALSWHRLAIPTPDWLGDASPADLAAALAAGGQPYFTTLLRLREHLTREQEDRVVQALHRHGREIRALVAGQHSRGELPAKRDLSAAWSLVEADLKTICASCTLSLPHARH